MDHHLRLFIAIDLPHDVKQLLHDLQAQLRRQTQAVRWSDPQGTHLTLKFLGGTRAALVPAIIEELERAAAGHRPFTLRTDALGLFPNPKRPRVVWLGVTGDLAALEQVQADVERRIAPLGFPTEQRRFSPHLTLGRSPKDPTPDALASMSRAVAQTSVLQKIAFAVDQIVLMRSELRPEGARYTPVAHARLDASA
ncbi:MAG TPA: RNA 2',3'-cyclic phosphodiesterase [Herpetosiphonaceae bacterium]